MGRVTDGAPGGRARRWAWGLSIGAWALLVAILVLGGAARFWNLDWDKGAYSFHPDEWALNEVVRRLGPDLNPHFFFYGSFPIYLYRGSAEVLGALTGLDWLDRERLALIGRFWSALASVATLLVVFAVGRRLWGVRAGLMSAALMAGAALTIQAAHFGTVESLITLAAALTLWASLRILDGGGWRTYALAGAVLGLAVATKLTAASFVLMPLLAHLLRGRQTGGDRRKITLLFGCALLAMLLAAPYYLLAWRELWAAIEEQSDELAGGPRFLYVWQFTGSAPYLFELRNLVVWGLGVPLGVAALVGWGRTISYFGRRSNKGVERSISSNRDETSDPISEIRNPKWELVLVLWPTLYFLYVGTWQARFVRHLMPLVPFCCLFAGGLLAAIAGTGKYGDMSSGWRNWRRWIGKVVAGVVLAGAAGWGLAFTAVYANPDTRLAATEWFRTNVSPGTRLVVEDKHEPLIPLPDAIHPAETYNYNVLKVTQLDTPQKMGDFAGALATGDLLILPDRRWSATLPRLPAFPLTTRYYRLLFDGWLGYAPVATFASPPRLGPFAWPDDDAEETFQVFDHPTVQVFRNTGRLSEGELRRLLGAGP